MCIRDREKIDMLDFADAVAINKFDRKGAEDALRDVRKQVQRNHKAFNQAPDEMPVYGTIAARFNDDGVDVYKRQAVYSARTFCRWAGSGCMVSSALPSSSRSMASVCLACAVPRVSLSLTGGATA